MNDQHHVLIVDDDQSFRILLSKILTKNGYQTMSAAQGTTALKRIAKHEFPVILIDLILGETDGLALMQEVKKISPSTECIIITGHASKETAIEALKLGAYSYLQKPHNNEELLITIERAIKKRGTEIALRESEDKYRSLIENSSNAIGVQIDDEIVFMNNAGIELFGSENLEQLLEKSVWDIVHPMDIQTVKKQFHLMGEKGESLPPIELKFIRLDGKGIHLEVTASPITFQNKFAIQAIFRDITQRKNSEKLQDAVYQIAQAPSLADNLDELYETIHEIIKSVMPAENFYIALYDEEFELISFPYFIDEEDAPPSLHKPGKSLTDHIFRTGQSLLCDMAMHREMERRGEVELIGSTSPIWLGVPLKVEDKTIGVMAIQHYDDPEAYGENEQRMLEFVSTQVAHAIEHKRAEEALQDSEAFTRAVIEHSPIGISVRSKNGQLLSFNKAWQDIWAIPDDEININLTKVRDDLEFDLRDTYLAPHLEKVKKVYKEGGLLHITDLKTSGKRPGSALWVSQHFYAIKDDDGEVAQVVILTEDVSEKKKVEEKIRKLNDELEQRTQDRTAELEISNKELEAFSYSVSHDLRAPLRAINGFSSILAEEYSDVLDDEALDYLERMRTSSKKMDRLINDLLSLSRLGRTELTHTTIDLTEIAKRVFNSLAQEEPHREFNFKVTPCPKVVADEHLMEVMLNNLFSNAIKFTRDRLLGLIEFGCQESEEGLVFFVRDNGVGFNMKFVDKIFSPFHRLHTEVEFDGTGIGLALVRRIIQRHGGQIWAESQENKGTTIFFRL